MASTYSPTLKRAVPSALVGLTSLFGMGRGGPHCNRHLKSSILIADFSSISNQNALKDLDELAIEVIRNKYYKSTGN